MPLAVRKVGCSLPQGVLCPWAEREGLQMLPGAPGCGNGEGAEKEQPDKVGRRTSGLRAWGLLDAQPGRDVQ